MNVNLAVSEMELTVWFHSYADNLHLGDTVRFSSHKKFQSGSIPFAFYFIALLTNPFPGIHWGTSSVGARGGSSVCIGLCLPLSQPLKIQHVGVFCHVEFGHVDKRNGIRGGGDQRWPLVAELEFWAGSYTPKLDCMVEHIYAVCTNNLRADLLDLFHDYDRWALEAHRFWFRRERG